jgi:hypothetical protein
VPRTQCDRPLCGRRGQFEGAGNARRDQRNGEPPRPVLKQQLPALAEILSSYQAKTMTRTRRWLVHGKKPGRGARLPPCSGTEMTFRYANRRGVSMSRRLAPADEMMTVRWSVEMNRKSTLRI